MSTAKPVIPVTNLKERIAALELKNAAERSTSPSPAVGVAPAAGAGALKDRIAKFEKKGAVPAPRGRFGLGAPPLLEAQIKRNGELYGNRIPQPVRFASGGSQPPSRSGSSIGFYNGSPDLNFSDMNNRRSFSLNVAANDEDGEYSPMTSPTFSSPPDSPDSTLPPEGSPTTSHTSEGSSGFKEPIRRAAPFAQVLENARKASEKTDALENMNDPLSPTPFVNSKRVVRQADVEVADPTPVPQPSPARAQHPVATVVTEEPASILETPFEVRPPPITAPTIVVDSPAPSPAVIVEVAPRAIAASSPIPPQQPVAKSTSSIPAETSRPLPSAPSTEELGKPKTRNNKDLTLNLEEVEPSPTNPTSEDENTTPTTANQLLSPAPNSAMSSVFSGSSYGSGGSSMISPRPFSMIDISLAERVTPATGRGNIVFVPPSTATMPRKADLVYFPPTPTEAGKVDETPEPSPRVPQVPQATSFSAVVHEKVKETPDPIPHPAALVPQTPTNRKTKAHAENKKWKRMTMMAPPTPMTGELASLIHNAVILETMVEKGELPWEAEAREERERERRAREEERLAAIAAERAKAAADDAKRRAALEAALVKQREREKAREQAEKEEEEFKTNKLRHTFLIPLSQAQNEHQQTHRKESSTSTINAKANRRTMIEKPSTEVPEVPHLPSKSPSIASSKSRFSSFRRLGSVKSVIAGRPSDVSMSDVDSVDEFGAAGGHGKESSWPSLSPTGKKSVGRASSFAEKMFSRSRTKSSGSTLSNASINEADKYTLPPLPDFIPQPSEPQASKGPRKSTSMKSLRGLMKKNVPPPMNIPHLPQAGRDSVTIPTAVVSPSSAGSPSSILSSPGPLKSPDYIGFGTMYPPSDLSARPTSMMSVSSLTSVLPSPLFEEDIFSAFPAVPNHTNKAPQAGNHVSTYGLAPVANGPGMSTATPSFDSTLLSSAAHLRPKTVRRGNGSTTPKSQTTALPQ